MNLAWNLETALWDYPEKTAVINAIDNSQFSYQQLAELTNQIGNHLRDEWQVEENTIVCTLLDDNAWHMSLMFSLFKLGAVFCGLNRSNQIEKFLQDLDTIQSMHLIVNRDYLAVANQLKEKIPELTIILCDTDTPFQQAVSKASHELRMVPRNSDDLAAINFTAGTTGASKGVMFTHGTLGLSVQNSIHWSGIRASDRIAAPISFFHSGGISDAIRSVMAKATIIWLNGWEAQRAMDVIERYKPNWFHFLVPTMIRDLMAQPRFADIDLTGIKVHMAGEVVPEDIQTLMQQRGMRAINFYGMTETMPCIICSRSMYYNDDQQPVTGSSGKPNREYGELKLRDVLSGETISQPNQEGEILFRGGIVTPGYYRNPEKTAEAIDADGWLHTSDLGYCDEQGNYFISGRVDDIISSGAEKLSLLEVEEAIRGCSIVTDIACVGVAHERFGHSPAAFVVTHDETLSEQEIQTAIQTHLAERLEKWKHPRLYVQLDEIPRTAAKKTKMGHRLAELIADVTLRNKDSATTLSHYRSRYH